ncbi:MAG: hypothetical protein GWM87_07220, partial [Xanthomonadales bacterium]|nr:hypothetical protein [Xanthomonadales bacterium]NIX12745.1 hypothetical protein [Xanthomonadales bacterium]
MRKMLKLVLLLCLVTGTTSATANPDSDSLPGVVVLATGGTIASQYDPATGKL